MDLTQIFIIISLGVFSLASAACAYYIIALLKDLRLTVHKTNLILDDARDITESVARPVSSFSDFLMGFRNGMKLFNSFFGKEKGE